MNPIAFQEPAPAPKGAPSPLACLFCRARHLKCDGQTPVCGRCAASGADCQYTPSRRGYKGLSSKGAPKRRRVSPPSPDQKPADSAPLRQQDGSQAFPTEWPIATEWAFPDGLGDGSIGALLAPGLSSPNFNESSMSLNAGPGPMTPESTSPAPSDGYLIDVYYNYFHSSHPILLPVRVLYRSPVPAYLDYVIKFIGSHFTPSANSETYRPSVKTLVMEQEGTLEKVQALLLLAVVLHSRNERTDAGDCLAAAVDLAFQLGLHRNESAILLGEGNPIREESLRRTFWELFVVEGILTALGVQRTFRLNSIPHEVPLPCEERVYQEGLPAPPAPTISQFDDRIFADEERDFSSFCYRIEAVRILGRIVAIQDLIEGQQDQVEAVDARLTSWFHHLPESKSELMRPDGSVDEMMFQATMIVNGAAIYLHFPRSDLLSSPAVAAEVICGHHGPCAIPAFSHHSHAMKAVKAASELSMLASIRLPVVKHTPFFICSLVLSSIVQLAACSAKAGQMPNPSRDRLTLTIGVFKSLARTWAISQSIMRQIKAVARDVTDVGLRPSLDHIDLTALLDNNRFWPQ